MFFGLIKIKRTVKCKNCNGTGKIKTTRFPSSAYRITQCGCCYGVGKIKVYK